MIYEKLQKCRVLIKSTKLKKEGRNTFSNYDYFTPSQVDKLVYDACLETKLFHKFDLIRNEYGIYGQLTIIDIETSEDAVFTMASDIPSIKATNISQQLGGAMTYTNRYLLQSVFGIVDNNLDFDSQDGRKKSDKSKGQNKECDIKPWLNFKTDAYTSVHDAIMEKKATVWTVRDSKKFRLSKEMQDHLEKLTIESGQQLIKR